MNMSLPDNVLQGIIGFIVVTAVLSFFSMRKQKAAWTGVVKGKLHYQDSETYQEYWSLIFLTDKGKKIEEKVFENVFNEFDEGDRVIKNSDDLFPRKIIK